MRFSSGVVEERVNRFKMLKRQMFGRVNFYLLRKRRPRGMRPFTIAVSMTLRGSGTESDPEPRFTRSRQARVPRPRTRGCARDWGPRLCRWEGHLDVSRMCPDALTCTGIPWVALGGLMPLTSPDVPM